MHDSKGFSTKMSRLLLIQSSLFMIHHDSRRFHEVCAHYQVANRLSNLILHLEASYFLCFPGSAFYSKTPIFSTDLLIVQKS